MSYSIASPARVTTSYSAEEFIRYDLKTKQSGHLIFKMFANAETNYDWLICYFNGVEVARLSAIPVLWKEVVIPFVGYSSNTLSFSYVCDGGGAGAADRGYVGDFTLKLAVMKTLDSFLDKDSWAEDSIPASISLPPSYRILNIDTLRSGFPGANYVLQSPNIGVSKTTDVLTFNNIYEKRVRVHFYARGHSDSYDKMRVYINANIKYEGVIVVRFLEFYYDILPGETLRIEYRTDASNAYYSDSVQVSNFTIEEYVYSV